MGSNVQSEESRIAIPAPDAGGLARSAGMLSLGSAASRVLGLAREMVITAYFGATGEVSAFRVAAQVPVLLYDFLIGGMLSAALVPVLSEYAQQRRALFTHLIATLLTLGGLGLALLVLVLELAAPQVAWLLAAGFAESDPALLDLTARLIRFSSPAVWLFSMAGLLTAMLYALQRFSVPALATAVYNLGIVLAAPLLARTLGITSLVVGMLAGAAAQVVIMAWDLQRAGVRLIQRPRFSHPAVGRILRLYAPIAAGLVVSVLQVMLDRRLASATGPQSIAWMSNATTLQQMPLGLTSVAISLAALPRLSRYYAAREDTAYRQTLGRGLRLVLLLVVPAAVLLWVLGEPLTRLLFERSRFTPQDTAHVVAALNIYVVGMLFAAVDYPLNFAFYARGNTWLPALVGVVSVGVYVAAALRLVHDLGYLGLAWADTAKQASHALIMAALLAHQIGRLHMQLGRGLLTILASASVMAGVAWGLAAAAAHWIAPGLGRDLVMLGAAGGGGLAVYAGLLGRAAMPEAASVAALVRRLLRRAPLPPG
ncbi:MAG: murein biosynthesis integral membrane protein MurJ [Caldilineaceae bacterium]|nr:murein biosynthesis integral membrane protein MurJ [Caldilineaceae bacterium]